MSVTYRRSDTVYYTPAQVTVYLNGYLVDDARMIDYRVLDNWTPLFGHNDRCYRTCAMGQTIVEGSLAINFRYHGYLKRVISILEDRDILTAGTARHGEPPQTLSDATLQQDAAAVLNYLDASGEASEVEYDKASKFLKARFWGERPHGREYDEVSVGEAHGNTEHESQEERDARRAVQDYNRPSVVSHKKLNLRIVHGPDASIAKRAYAEKLVGVQFRGKSYRANIVVPEGDEIVAEIYPFLARDLRPI